MNTQPALNRHQHKTNDGTIMDTRHSNAHWKGSYVRGRVAEILYRDRIDGYYLVTTETGAAEWYPGVLALEWLKNNGVWDIPRDLHEVTK